MQDGRIVEIGVLFADLTGYTPLTRRVGPERTHELVSAFFDEAKHHIMTWDGFVVQFAGDEVMALFNVPVRHDDFAKRAVAAASGIQEGMPDLGKRLGEDLRVTVGVASGHARVGRVGSDHIKDYTAIGEVVNRAARLVSRAEPGDILVDTGVFESVSDEFPDAPREQVSLKGFDEPVEVVSLGSGRVPDVPSPPAVSRPRAIRLGLLLAAVLGAPCAGLVALGPLAIGAGLGAAGIASVASTLDQATIRLPLLLLATTASLANLLAIHRSRRQLAGFAPSTGDLAGFPGQGRAARFGIMASACALAVIGFELIAHAAMH